MLKPFRRCSDDEGAALLTALLVMLFMAAVMAGFTALVITDTKVRSLDSSRTQSFYAVHAGLEKLTADLGDLFSANVAPTAAQVNALTATPPSVGGVTWGQPDGSSGYKISFPTDASGNAKASTMTVASGPYEGLVGLATPYTMTVTGHLPDGSEASLTRTLQTVAIPVFQFGIFSENDLSFFAGPTFDFGGRVHSNSNVFLAEGPGATLKLSDRVTAVGEVVRNYLANGNPAATQHGGEVQAITAPNAYRDLAMTEGSLVDQGSLSATLIAKQPNDPTWTNLSTGTYNHNIMNGRTGAKTLVLPITAFGGTPIGLIERPAVNENVTNPNVLAERFYTLASLRILLSDKSTDITSLPGVTGTAPQALGAGAPAMANGSQGSEPYTINLVSTSDVANRLPFASAPAQDDSAQDALGYGVRVPAGTPLLGGYIKIEMQTTPNNWVDVTTEILTLGIGTKQASGNCADPTPNAIVRIERPRTTTAAGTGGTNCGSVSGSIRDMRRREEFSPLVLFDTREGELRDSTADGEAIHYGGVMCYIELDVKNLSRWFQGAIGASGTQALNVNGYTVYFSDRRGNHNGLGAETGEYGNEDVVNPASATGTPNGALDTGEDFNGNGVLDTYGAVAQEPYSTPGGALIPWPSVAAPFAAGITPNSQMTGGMPGTGTARWGQMAVAERNPQLFFRRALKLTHGDLGNIVSPGLTIASENPVYVQGNYNANDAGFGDPHVAAAVLADSITMLSKNWNDMNSFTTPYDMGSRNAATTYYRFAVIAGKGLNFPYITTQSDWDYGTDGGAHNFLRYIENWGGQKLWYRGSIASMFYSRQATGT